MCSKEDALCNDGYTEDTLPTTFQYSFILASGQKNKPSF